MLRALNRDPDACAEVILNNVRDTVEWFTGNAEQFDDLTMMCLEYRGSGNS